jgi:serine/threonine protein kinase
MTTGKRGMTPIQNSIPLCVNVRNVMFEASKFRKFGDGNSGIVYKAKDDHTGELVALQIMKIENDDAIYFPYLNIFVLRVLIGEPGSVPMVSRDVDIFLHSFLLSKPFDSNLLCFYIFQLLCRVLVLHTHRIIHIVIIVVDLLEKTQFTC